jgi:uncharacterized protein (DUF4213/DUF364 family)
MSIMTFIIALYVFMQFACPTCFIHTGTQYLFVFKENYVPIFLWPYTDCFFVRVCCNVFFDNGESLFLPVSEVFCMLVNKIYEYVLSSTSGLKAADIRIGLGYTAVLLEDGRCGLAYTLHEKEYESCCVVPDAGKLAGRSISELISWIKTPDAAACAVGLAAVNAAVTVPESAVESDITDLLAVESGDSVGMIGYFGPLVKPIKERVRALYIFERRPDPEYGILPESASPDLLPKCQVVIMTATAILNHTIDSLLDLSKNAREIAILGPSTPFLPEIFGHLGVTMLSGLQVIDSARILQIVSEGGGTRQFGRAVRKLSLRLTG